MWVRQEVRMTPPPNMVRQENRVTMVGVWKREESQFGFFGFLSYRLAKLYTGYMALGNIARHKWLYSHWLFSHVYMAI